ncbi:MAG TPA: methyltransferase domain-containing protein [Rectinemataceae bacterium]|nr:methyltransferase domain-containing protein [Rectinemataceae bacterium]
MTSIRVLLVPSVSKGNGSGHIVRSFRLARSLGYTAAVYLPATKTDQGWSAAELRLSYTREIEGVRIVDDLATAGAWDLVLLDRRATSYDELGFWESIAPVASLDEGGEAREAASYLIDILPRLEKAHRRGNCDSANSSSLGFLDLPQHRRTPPSRFRKILVSFGGEDPAGLALPLSRALLSLGLVEASDLTLVSGALRRGAPPLGLEGVTVLGPVQDLKEHLHGWDLVFTQFGLTAFEAAWSGCGVILFNPSSYHRALARRAGFPEIGVGTIDRRSLLRWIGDVPATLARAAAILPAAPQSIAALVGSLETSGPVACPLCGSRERKAIHREANKSYFRCQSCGMLYLTRFGSTRKAPYTATYFFDEYRRQYGRSYLDDWPALVSFAATRLASIEALAAKTLGRTAGLSLLDVGCAYGPYLEAAKARGHEPYGIDISTEAARYVREELGLPAVPGDFADIRVAGSFGGPFDCISLWYVIEHFEDLDAVLRNASALLRTGGILAISTPSGEGVSARFAPASFFSASPEDHFTIWEPSRARVPLAFHGFRLEKIRITGHHSERFPFLREGGIMRGRFRKLCLGLFDRVSRLFGLGDTFELYAVKVSQTGEPRELPPIRERGLKEGGGADLPSSPDGNRIRN